MKSSKSTGKSFSISLQY